MPESTDYHNRKIGFNNLDNFLKIAPLIGMTILVYLQSLFPSKTDFEKMEQMMYGIEKQIIEIKTLQSTVAVNTKAIQDIQQKLQALEIQIVKIQQQNN